MEFYQRKKGNVKYLKEYGCVISSVLFQAYKMLDLDKKIDITLNEFFVLFSHKDILNEDGDLVWGRIQRVFPQIQTEVHLWNGKHKDLDLIGKNAIISVDWKKDSDYNNSHFVAVIEKTDDNIRIYNPYFDTKEYITERYLIDDSIKSSIFSVINLRKA